MRAAGFGVAIGLVASSGVAQAAPPAVPQPQLDLGQTSFLDGEAGPGGLVELIGDGAIDSTMRNTDGARVDGRNQLRAASLVVHPAYVSDIGMLGGNLGVEALVPVSSVRASMAGDPSQSRTGFGDITIAPFVQWSHLFGRPLSLRLAAQVVAPTGNYAPGRALNPGAERVAVVALSCGDLARIAAL